MLFNAGCIINKCFLLNPEKKLAQIRIVVFEKNEKTHIYFRMTSPSRRQATLNSS